MDEALQHHLTRQRADVRARDARGHKRNAKHDRRRAAEQRRERLVRRFDRGHVGVTRLVEHARRHEQHRHVDQTREAHCRHDVDLLEREHPLRFLFIRRDNAATRQVRVDVDDVRHHRRANDPDGQQGRAAARQ